MISFLKRKIILSIKLIWCFFLTGNSLNAQFFNVPFTILDSATIKVTYTLNWKEDTNNLKQERSEKMILLAGEDKRMFMGKNFYELYIIGRKAESEGKLQSFFDRNEMQNYSTRFSYRILKNYPKGYYTYYDKVIPDYLQYSESFSVFKWELLNETDSIREYPVQKARCIYGGREWIAWYTSSIPINDGPYKFQGLPGLIVKIHDSKEHYTFELDEIERYEEYLYVEFEDRGWINTTRENFLKAERSLKLDIVNRAKEAGANTVSQQRAYRNMLKKNNPIELE